MAAQFVIRKANGGQIPVTPSGGITAISDAGVVTLGGPGSFTTLDASAAVNLSPTGVTVAIQPNNGLLSMVTTGSTVITMTSAAAGSINNMSIGQATPLAGAFTSLTYTTSLKSTTALATPSALAATQFTGFASTVSGAAIMGYGTTNDVTLMNRAGTVCLGVGPNTTAINVPGTLTAGDLISGTGKIHDYGSAQLGIGGSAANRMYVAAGTTALGSATLAWGSSADATAGTDTYLNRENAAILEMGNDAAGVVNQTFKACDRVTSDGVGANLTIAAGRNRGASAGGSLIRQTSAPAAATVTGTLANREYIYGGEKTLTESTATIVANITLAAGTYIGGSLIATTHADDATDFQSITDVLIFSAVNKGGTVTATISAPTTSTTAASSVATLATTWTIVANGNSVDIKNSAVSSLSQTTLACAWQLRLNGNAAQVVTP